MKRILQLLTFLILATTVLHAQEPTGNSKRRYIYLGRYAFLGSVNLPVPNNPDSPPIEGDVAYDTALKNIVFYDGTGWKRSGIISVTGITGQTTGATSNYQAVIGIDPNYTTARDAYATSQAATREPAITAGTTAQYWRGDKTWQTLTKAAVGLPNAENTSDANKPISTATQTALDGKVSKAGDDMTGELREVNTINNTVNYSFSALPTINQNSNAGYAVFRAFPYEQNIGTGGRNIFTSGTATGPAGTGIQTATYNLNTLGVISALELVNLTSPNNARIQMGSGGTIISRGTNDGNTALVVNQQVGTGNPLSVRFNNVDRFNVTYDGKGILGGEFTCATPTSGSSAATKGYVDGMFITASATLDFASTAGQSSRDLTISVPGAIAGKPVMLGVTSAPVLTNLCYTAVCLANDVVTVRENNYGSAAQDAPSGTFTVQVAK